MRRVFRVPGPALRKYQIRMETGGKEFVSNWMSDEWDGREERERMFMVHFERLEKKLERARMLEEKKGKL